MRREHFEKRLARPSTWPCLLLLAVAAAFIGCHPSGSLDPGRQESLQGALAPAPRLHVYGFTSYAPAGQQGNVTVAVKDALGLPVASYSGTISLTSNDPMAILPGNYTFVPGVAEASLPVTLGTAGTWELIASDTSNAATMGHQVGIVVHSGCSTTLW